MILAKKQTFRIISPDHDGYKPSKIFDIFIVALIVISIIITIADTFDDLPLAEKTISSALDTVITIVFTVEFVLRIWTADLLYPDCSPTKARLKYLLSLSAIIDLLAILPFYLPFVFPMDLKFLRMFKLFRLIRVFKISRYSDAFSSIGKVIRSKAHQLISSIAVVLTLMLIASLVMYGFEHEAQPEVFENAFSGMWWAMATLTTVGYGDIYPVTEIGRLVGAVIALLGIGIVAVPTGIISAGFVEQIEGEEEKIELEAIMMSEMPDQLERLFELKQKGVLTEEEYNLKKADLLARW